MMWRRDKRGKEREERRWNHFTGLVEMLFKHHSGLPVISTVISLVNTNSITES